MDLQRLFESAIAEEQYFLEAHQKRLQFYASLVSAVFAATIAGGIQATAERHYLLLLCGPLLIASLCLQALGATFRLYQRFLEAVTVRAKLEQALGLTDKLKPRRETDYWRDEPLLATRHLEARQACHSSAEFCKRHRSTGYHRYTRLLFASFAIAAAILAGLLLLTAFPK